MLLFLLATSLSFLSVFHSTIIQFILSIFFPIRASNSPIRDEICSVEAEIAKVSMVDEFPKYARLRRKLNALKEQLTSEVKNKAAVNMKSRLYLKLLLQAPFVCISLVCFYLFRSVPVINLPSEWLEPYPFPNLISWPSGELGGVSFLVWFSISSQVFQLVKSQGFK